ncbi:hypothetical protein FOZ61_001123, partial [Perkinsus olseni]
WNCAATLSAGDASGETSASIGTLGPTTAGSGLPRPTSSNRDLKAISASDARGHPGEAAGNSCPDSPEEDLQMLWAVQETADGAPAKQAGPTLTLHPAGGQPSFTALLDSGAVRNYVSHELAVARGWKISPCSTSAKLANGAVVKLSGTTQVTVNRDGRDHELQFFVLPGSGASPGVDGSTCILGVRSMCALKISLCFDEVSGSRQVIVRTPVRPSSDSSSTDLAQDGHLLYVALAGEDLPITVVEERQHVVYRCERGVDELLAVSGPAQESACFGRTAKLGAQWRQVKAAPEYSIRLRPLADGEAKDCPTQSHTVEVRWSSSPLARQGPVHDYSQSLFAGLSSSQQQSYLEELDRFQERGWWEPLQERLPSEGTEDHSCLPEAIAFPVVQGEKARECYITAEFIPRGLLCHDPRAARALHGHTAVIRSLGRRYAARRLVFGLRCGPAVLREALTCLIEAALSNCEASVDDLPLLHWEYVDDICLLGERTAVEKLRKEIVRLGGQWGFEFPAKKSHSLCFLAAGEVEEFADFKHLGVLFTFSPGSQQGSGSLVLRCITSSDPAVTVFKENQRVTKRSLFRAAGAAFDPLSLHADRCLAADYVRRTSGRWKAGWDQDVSLNADEAATLTACFRVLSARSGHCDHATSFTAASLEVSCDSSPFGMGFVVHLVQDDLHRTPLAQRARCFRGSMLNWHQNRKESFGLAAAHVFVDSLVPYLDGINLRFLSDSRTALSWLRGGARLTCKSIERIAIARLCDAIADVREVWRRKYHVVPDLLHVAASQNTESDGLSRLASSWGIPENIIFEGRGTPGTRPASNLAEDADDREEGVLLGLASSPTSTTLDDSTVLGHLRVISSTGDTSRVPPDFQLGHGSPPRERLQSLQWLSPTSASVLRMLGATPPEGQGTCPSSPLPQGLSSELSSFSLADDGLLMKEVNGVASTRTCYYVPTDTAEGRRYAQSLVEAYHHESGCLNSRYVRWMISRCFYIHKLRAYVESVCRACEGCQAGSNRRYFTTVDSARSLRTGARECWHTVSADLAEMGWDKKRRYSAVLLMTCHYSGYCTASPLKDQRSPTVAGEMSRLFDLLGHPVRLRTDGGPCFKGRPLADMLSSRSVTHHILPPYAAFSNGLAERAIASLKFLARQLGDKRSWPSTLSRVLHRLNGKPFLDTGLSPFEIFYGRPLRLSPENALEEGSLDASGHAAQSHQPVRDEIDRLVQAALDARQQRQEDARGLRRRGPPPVGSEVIVFNPDTLGRGGRYDRTIYRVLEIVRGVVLKLVDAK